MVGKSDEVEKKRILGVGVHPLTLTKTVEIIGGWIRNQYMWEEITGRRRENPFLRSEAGIHKPPDQHTAARQVVTLNAEMLYRAQTDKTLKDLLNQADLVVPDGYGVVWAGRQLGCPLPERVTGIDLMQALARRAAREKWRVYLLGAAPGVANAAATNLELKYPGLCVVGTQHGYFGPDEVETVIRKIRAVYPDLLFVALGSPKQEFFIWAHRQELGALVAIGVGGSFDVLSGRLRRAPLFFQRLHLEWFYRFIQEPYRWRRLIVLPRFVLMVMAAARRAGQLKGQGFDK